MIILCTSNNPWDIACSVSAFRLDEDEPYSLDYLQIFLWFFLWLDISPSCYQDVGILGTVRSCPIHIGKLLRSIDRLCSKYMSYHSIILHNFSEYSLQSLCPKPVKKFLLVDIRARRRVDNIEYGIVIHRHIPRTYTYKYLNLLSTYIVVKLRLITNSFLVPWDMVIKLYL